MTSCPQRRTAARLLLAWLLAGVSWAQCPNSCSGHGACGGENVCSCFEGFKYAPDCSLREALRLEEAAAPRCAAMDAA
jgi:hypothetical protein